MIRKGSMSSVWIQRFVLGKYGQALFVMKQHFRSKLSVQSINVGRDLRVDVVQYHGLQKIYQQKNLSHPRWKLREFKKDVMDMYQLNVTKRMCLRARARVLGEEMGSLHGHYAKLWDYKKELKRTNEGSTVEIEKLVHPTSDQEYFTKNYICFGALKKGFVNGCRPVLGFWA